MFLKSKGRGNRISLTPEKLKNVLRILLEFLHEVEVIQIKHLTAQIELIEEAN